MYTLLRSDNKESHLLVTGLIELFSIGNNRQQPVLQAVMLLVELEVIHLLAVIRRQIAC
jgi:hypothetical protein